MIPLFTQSGESPSRLVSSVYDICVFGNGTVNERDKKFVRAKLMPSYIQAKWIHFNKFGLNATKVENACIMFVAKASVITLDLIILPLAFSAGHAQIQLIPIIIETTKLLVLPIPQLILQDYLERQFNKDMFEGKEEKFLNEIKGAEEFIVKKHTFHFTLRDDYLNILKKFTELPMLNYIFFYSQMNDEYILYRNRYSKKESIHFKNLDDAVLYFKITFRMLRFYYHSEIHALNYFFNHAFQKIMDFYLNMDSLREKFISVFYPSKTYTFCEDIKYFLGILNVKIQKNRNNTKTQPEICEETVEQFQYFYFSFFYRGDYTYTHIQEFLDSTEVQKIIADSPDDSVKLKSFFAAALGSLLSYSQPALEGHLTTPITNKAKDFLSLILNTLTNISSPERSKKIAGSLAVIGIAAVIGGVIGATVLGVKYKHKLSPIFEKANKNFLVPMQNFFIEYEKKISDFFSLNSTLLPSDANRVIGSVIFIASYIPNLGSATSLIHFLRQVAYFHPLRGIILRSATNFTKMRMQQRDMDILFRIDRVLRLGYTEDGILIIKILGPDHKWFDNFDMDLVDKEFLNFLTHDFARVVRHQCQNMGILFEQIAFLDREIEVFERSGRDFLYTGRAEDGPEFFTPMCRVTTTVTPEMLENRSKKRFFDILIERQTLLISLIHRSYYVTLYNLFMTKMKEKCKQIFNEHLPFALDVLEKMEKESIKT